MSNCYHLEFTAPSKNAPTTTWADKLVAAATPGTQSSSVVMNPTDAKDIPPNTLHTLVVEVDKDVPATVVISGGNWPKPCTGGIMLELEWSFSKTRDELGLLYTKPLAAQLAQFPAEYEASRRITLSCSACGLLTVTGHLLSFTIDLNAMSTANEPHAHRIVVVPGVLPTGIVGEVRLFENGKLKHRI